MSMIVTQLSTLQRMFTLCCQIDGDIQPVADFTNQDNATYLMNKINQAGHVITLKEPSQVREFCVGTYQDGRLQTKWVAPDLKMALQKLGIKVDFEVEPQEAPELFLI